METESRENICFTQNPKTCLQCHLLFHPSSRSERSYVVLSVCTLANFCNYLYLPNAAAVSVSGCCVSIYSVADALADADGAASNTLLASF